jgi:hypothetical protein
MADDWYDGVQKEQDEPKQKHVLYGERLQDP